MEECQCPHGKDLNRWSKILDGNGEQPIGTRMKLLETELKHLIERTERNEGTMENLLKSSEALRKNVSAMMQTYGMDKKHRRKVIGDTLNIILVLVAIASLIIGKLH